MAAYWYRQMGFPSTFRCYRADCRAWSEGGATLVGARGVVQNEPLGFAAAQRTARLDRSAGLSPNANCASSRDIGPRRRHESRIRIGARAREPNGSRVVWIELKLTAERYTDRGLSRSSSRCRAMAGSPSSPRARWADIGYTRMFAYLAGGVRRVVAPPDFQPEPGSTRSLVSAQRRRAHRRRFAAPRQICSVTWIGKRH